MDVVNRLAHALGDPDGGGTSMGTAKVINASAGTFGDGRHKITVSWRTASIDAAYLASYTPALNDFVVFIKSGSSFFVLGKAA